MREIGERLQARARELGLTDVDVARRLGLAQNRYANYVSGVREPDMATFVRICRELGSTPNELLGFEESERARGSGPRARIDVLLDDLDGERLAMALGLLKVVAGSGRAGSAPSPARKAVSGASRRSATTKVANARRGGPVDPDRG